MVKKLTQEHDPMSHIIESVRALCPAAVTDDGRIDIDVLKSELSDFAVSNLRERYEFMWVGKENAKREYKRKINKTLRPDIDASRDWSSTGNLYIEGDNLDALKLLQKSYSGRIKMIYIDPPYNTGNDFVYCDEYAEDCGEYLSKKERCDESGNRLYSNKRDGGHFHSNWCSMMYPRLCIARTLLSPDGVIFISIDDNEITNLKKICDEIFGENNFVTSFVWHNNVKGRQFDKHVKNTYENILMYVKNSNVLELNLEYYDVDTTGLPRDEISCYTKGYPLHNGTADFHIENRPNLAYSIYYNPLTGDAYTKDEKIYVDGKPVIGPATENRENYVRIIPKYNTKYNNQRVWRWGADKFNSEYKTELIFTAEEDGWYIYGKDRIHGNQACKAYKNYINIDSGNGKTELVNLGLSRIFDNPKTYKLVQHLLKIVSDKDSIILDFFSGSGTTAHAVMQQNATDGGHRRFILVQLPETTDEKSEAYKSGYKTICDIGRERIRRAGTKIVSDTGQTDLDIGFRALRIDSSNMSDGIMSTPGQTVQSDLLSRVDNIKQGRGPLDLLFGVMIECGISLDSGIVTKTHHGQTYYSVNNGELIACFDNELSPELICEIARQKPMCAVFRDSSFADAKDKINVSEIFKNFCGDDKCLRIL